MAEELSFDAVLSDIFTPTLDAIIASLEQIAEVAAQAAEAMSAAFGEASADADALAGSADAAAASTDALAGSMDAATASTDANSAAALANADKTKAATDAHAKFVASAKAMIMPLTIATALVVGTGVAALHMAGDFQSGLTTLVTGAGELQSNMQLMHDGILHISTDTGESTSQLISGAFMIESAGHHGADALNFLAAAAEGAKVGAADLGTVADAETTIATDYASAHITAAQAVNTLVATVQNGKTHMDQLGQSLATILPTASAAGISLKDVMAAMATMTGEAVPAAQSATFLRQTILALMAPSKQTTDALAAVGLKASDVAAEMQKSLPDALARITEAVSKKFPEGSARYMAAMKNIAGGSKQMQGILDLTGQHMTAYQHNVAAITQSVNEGGKSVTGWAQVQQDFNQQLSEGMASLQVVMIKFGEALMPVATALVKDLTPAIKGLGEWVSTHGQQAAVAFGMLAAVLGGALVTALGAVALASFPLSGAAMAAVAIGAAIAGLAAGFAIAYNTSKPFHDAINGIGSAFGAAWHWVQVMAQTVGQQLAPTFHQLGAVVSAELLPTWKMLQGLFTELTPVFKALGAVVGGVLVVALGLLIGVITGLVEAFATVLTGVIQFVGGIVQAIVGMVKLIVDLWTGLWTIFSDIFSGNTSKLAHDWNAWGMSLWTDLVNIFLGLFNAVNGLFTAFYGGVMAFWRGFVTGIIGWFVGLYDTLVGHSIVPDMINGIVSWFEQLPGRVVNAVKTVVTLLTGVFDKLAQTALQWGANLISGLINGIKNMAGGVANAAGGIAGTIANFLGHHSPAAEGPGATSDEWMPNLGRMLATGLLAQAPLVGAAATAVAGRIATALGSPSGTLGANGGAFPASALATNAATSGAPAQITVVLKDETGMGGFIAGARLLDPRVMQLLAQEIAKEMQAQGLLQGRQPIGYTGSK